jgi:hypothetical protein
VSARLGPCCLLPASIGMIIYCCGHKHMAAPVGVLRTYA